MPRVWRPHYPSLVHTLKRTTGALNVHPMPFARSHEARRRVESSLARRGGNNLRCCERTALPCVLMECAASAAWRVTLPARLERRIPIYVSASPVARGNTHHSSWVVPTVTEKPGHTMLLPGNRQSAYQKRFCYLLNIQVHAGARDWFPCITYTSRVRTAPMSCTTPAI